MSNPTFLITTEISERWVLRKKPPGSLLPKAHAVDREHRIMSALADTRVPVPRMRAYCDDREVIGVEFFLMEYVEGRVVSDPGMSGIQPAQRREIAFALVDTLACLHNLDWRHLGLADYGRPEGFMARQVRRWSGQYDAAKTALPASLDHSDMDWLRDWLAEHGSVADNATIVHGDFRLGNVILHPRDARPLAVLDWELSTIGHPLSDLAYLMLPYHLPRRLPQFPDLRENGLPTEREILNRYAQATGRAVMNDWPLFLAFSCFRYAAIVHGVAARAAQGNASSARADPTRDANRAMAVASLGREIAASCRFGGTAH
ncbi:aminoglycoside phosphotransferase (APT) family kinase protein [Breoghania corrubedonensis]|uniref:Aminoglycoside phosphotransferase (APT) family kinase protein n=2 Tax=Breoghania corrubedonensis TaxID=665038 RepID=A0A2T5US63_9HYPH|nr:aminoglycoside phosphotransferase (APT) family kinase protein [Breoghania corrubedonensis]